MFAAKSLTLGQVDALVKKIGGIETAKALLQGTVTFEIKKGKFRDFTHYRTITIGGDSKESLLKKLKDGGYRVSDRAWDIMSAPKFTVSEKTNRDQPGDRLD